MSKKKRCLGVVRGRRVVGRGEFQIFSEDFFIYEDYIYASCDIPQGKTPFNLDTAWLTPEGHVSEFFGYGEYCPIQDNLSFEDEEDPERLYFISNLKDCPSVQKYFEVKQ